MLGSGPQEREFLLFSDCLVWLSNADKSDEADRSSTWDMLHRESSMHDAGRKSIPTPPLVRTRSKSDTDSANSPVRRRDSIMRLKIGGARRKRQSTGGEDRWLYRGHIDLVDLEIVVGPPGEADEERRFEVLSPKKSFAVYAGEQSPY